MNVSQNQERLILRDLPSSRWLAGGSFIFLATVFISKGMGVLLGFEQAPGWVAQLLFTLGLWGLGAGIVAIMHNPMVATEFDLERNLVAVRRQGWLPAHPLEVPFQHVAAVEVTEVKSTQGNLTYCLQLKTVNGQQIPLCAGWTSGKQRHDAAAAQIRGFLGAYGLRV